MNDLCSIVVIGRIANDAKMSYLSTGMAKMNIAIACNESVKINGNYQDKAHFFDVVLWGKLAENLQKYLIKGQQVAITGRLKQDRWNDQNGSPKSRIYINAENVQLIGKKKEAADPKTQVLEQATSIAELAQQAATDEFPDDISW